MPFSHTWRERAIDNLPNPHSGVPTLQAPAACVIDHDNLINRSGRGRPRSVLDVIGLAKALARSGVAIGTLCRNRDMSSFGDQLWHQLGFQVIAAHRNCDPQVIIALINYIEVGFRRLILIGGDGDYTHAVQLMRRCDVYVEVWSQRRNLSHDLKDAADGVRFIDHLVIEAPVTVDGRRTQASPSRSSFATP